MAGRLPGPVGSDFDHTPRIDSGTLALVQSPRPGVVGQELAHGVHGYAYQEHDLRWTQTLDAADAIWQALKASQPMVGAIVLQETGVALTHIVQGLIPGLMMAVGVVAASTVIGAAAGAAVGALAGGVGAAPGGALGGQVGFDAGMAGLALLGLGFLAEGFVSGLPGLRAQCELGIRRAVNSLFVPAAARPMEIQEASRHLAQAQAQLLKLVLMAVVAWLLKNPTLAAGKQAASSATGAASALRSGEALATAEANVAQLVAKLRASRLGAGFADWVEGNWRSLVENPRLRPRVMQAGGAAKQAEVVTPSQLAKMRNSQAASGPAPNRGINHANNKVNAEGKVTKSDTSRSQTLKNRVKANLEESAKARSSSSFEQLVRHENAYNFYTQHAGYSADRAMSHLSGIDFTQPVSIVEVQPGTKFIQHVGARGVGNYFAPPGTPAEMLGINPAGRTPMLFEASEPEIALRSTASKVVDTWTEATPFQSEGGGTQFFIPNKSAMTPSK
jgi:hypothetical protein